MSEEIKIGLASIIITPEEPIWMWGYDVPVRQKPYTSVLNHLTAKAMGFELSNGDKAILLTVDLGYLWKNLAEAIVDKIIDATDLKPEHILICMSHTHSGPILIHESTDVGFPSPSLMTAEEKAKTEAYTTNLIEKLAGVSAAALADMRPAIFEYGVGNVEFVINRRRLDEFGKYIPGLAGTRMYPPTDANVDKSVPVLKVSIWDNARNQYKIISVVFGCACHNVSLGIANDRLSGDFSSFAQTIIEKKLSAKNESFVQTMFIQGCGGNANPYLSNVNPWFEDKTVGIYTAYLCSVALAQEVIRVVEGRLKRVNGPLMVARRNVEMPLMAIPSSDYLQKLVNSPTAWDKWDKFNTQRMLDALERGESLPRTYTAPIAVWQFGNDLTLVALSGEVVSDYVDILRKNLNKSKMDLWVAAYSNELFGYLPSVDVIYQGGYETRGLFNNTVGFFDSHVEGSVVGKVKELVDELKPSW